MYSYFAYGLKIHSAIPIPEFIALESTLADVTLSLKQSCILSNYVSAELVEKPGFLKLDREKAIFYIKNIGVFLVEKGTTISIIPVTGVSEQWLRFYIVGTIMGILLYQRDLLVLHASVVNINGSAIAFLGVSGEGKSSTTAAFLAGGYNFVTDDVAPINLKEKLVTINPGFPQIKLGRKTADALGYDFKSLHLIDPFDKKRGYRPSKNFSLEPLPIQRIYVLTSDSKFGIEAIRPSEAVIEIARHSRPTTLYHFGGKPHFFQCAELVKKYTIYRLKRPRNLELLPKLVEMVEADLREK